MDDVGEAGERFSQFVRHVLGFERSKNGHRPPGADLREEKRKENAGKRWLVLEDGEDGEGEAGEEREDDGYSLSVCRGEEAEKMSSGDRAGHEKREDESVRGPAVFFKASERGRPSSVGDVGGSLEDSSRECSSGGSYSFPGRARGRNDEARLV